MKAQTKEDYKRNNLILYYFLVRGKQKIDIGRMFEIKRQRVQQIIEYKIKKIMESNKRYFYFDVLDPWNVKIVTTHKEPEQKLERYIFDTQKASEFLPLVEKELEKVSK